LGSSIQLNDNQKDNLDHQLFGDTHQSRVFFRSFFQEIIKSHNAAEKERRDLELLKELYAAVEEGHAFKLIKLLNQGVSVDGQLTRESKNNDTVSPLYMATSHNHCHIVRILLCRGASVRILDSSGGTVLHKAVLCGNLDIVCQLLTYGAAVDATDKDGKTALHQAALKSNFDIVQQLLLLSTILDNIDVNAIDHSRNTALHYAAASKAYDVIELLLTYGADPHVKNMSDKTPEQLMVTMKHKPAIQPPNDKRYHRHDNWISLHRTVPCTRPKAPIPHSKEFCFRLCHWIPKSNITI